MIAEGTGWRIKGSRDQSYSQIGKTLYGAVVHSTATTGTAMHVLKQ